MAATTLRCARILGSTAAPRGFLWSQRTRYIQLPRQRDLRFFASSPDSSKPSSSSNEKTPSSEDSTSTTSTAKSSASFTSSSSSEDKPLYSPAWEDEEFTPIEDFSQLPHKDFGKNQFIETNEEFKRALRQILRRFPPISHAFAYGSGVFPQSDASASKLSLSPHPNPPEAILKWQKGGGKMIDFILATKFSEHFHSLNMHRHRDHYSFLASLGSGTVSYVNDKIGAGAYFNPYITVNGTLIKYGVVSLKTLERDLTEWDTLYLAGRLHKPVKILYEDASIRLANQRNLMAAVRCALLMLPENFTEHDLYTTITSLSYTGDPRMSTGSENPNKISNIVTHQLRAFRQLYSSLISELPNIKYSDSRLKSSNPDWESLPDKSDLKMSQNMDPAFRGNMVRRLPKSFREKLYFLYQRKFGIPGAQFKEMLAQSKDEDAKGGVRKPVGSDFDRRIAAEEDLAVQVKQAVKQTVQWPSSVQSVKSFFTAGLSRSWRYMSEKRAKHREGQ